MTIRNFGHGNVEARSVIVTEELRRRSRRSVVENISDGEERAISEEERLEWMAGRAARARRNMRWRCLSLGADHMWTVTKRGKFETLDEFWETWERFMAQAKKLWPELPYVVVPERHACGRWHAHVAVRGFFPAGLVRRIWLRALGGRGDERGEDSLGNVDMKHMTGRKGVAVIARYISKYIGKSFGHMDKHRRSYACSRGLVPVAEKVSISLLLNGLPIWEVREMLRGRFKQNSFDIYEWSHAGLSGFIVKTCGS